MIGQGVLVQKKKLPEHFSAQAAFSLINFFILFSLAFAPETVHNNNKERRDVMIRISGEYTEALVYTDSIDDCAYLQIDTLCNHFALSNARIRVMPDCHAGNACIIGFTAILTEKRIIPNIVGVDIGCGVMSTIFTTKDNIDFRSLDSFIRTAVPSGLCIREACPAGISPEAIADVDSICRIINAEGKRDMFLCSLGTLGGGNHFIEVGRIADNTYMLTVHTGSRSLGFHICKYFQKHGSVIDEELKHSIIEKHRTAATTEEHIAIQNEANNMQRVSDDLAYISGEIYDNYISCMIKAMHYAHENRTIISDMIMQHLTATANAEVTERFDTVHNYIDRCDDGRIIIRKGAVSANAGQLLCIPLNMRDGIVVGTGRGNAEWNNSAPHGSGRALSRSQARNTISMEEYISSMDGICTWSVNESTLDESPMAYKPSEEIIRYLKDTVDIRYIARTVYNFKAN